VNTRFLKVAAILVAVFVYLQIDSNAQTRARTSAQPAPNLLASLPESDAVAQIRVRRLINDVMPRLLAAIQRSSPQANADIDQLRPAPVWIHGLLTNRAERPLQLPFRGYYKTSDGGLAKGSFNPGAIVAAGRLAANGKYHEEKYQGKTIYVFLLDQEVRFLGLFGFKVRQLRLHPWMRTHLRSRSAERKKRD